MSRRKCTATIVLRFDDSDEALKSIKKSFFSETVQQLKSVDHQAPPSTSNPASPETINAGPTIRRLPRAGLEQGIPNLLCGSIFQKFFMRLLDG